MPLAPKGTALLVIDAQLGAFRSPLIPPVHDGEMLLHKISSLISQARASKLPVFFIQHCGGRGHPLEKGTKEFEIHTAVAPLKDEVVIQKRFCDSFQETSLQAELESRGIGQIVIAGLATEYCVDTASRRGFSLGYSVSLVLDAHSTWDATGLKAKQIVAHHNRVLGELFAKLVSADSAFGRQPDFERPRD